MWAVITNFVVAAFFVSTLRSSMAVAVFWASTYQAALAAFTTIAPNVCDIGFNDTTTYYPPTTASELSVLWDLGTASTVTQIRYTVGYAGSPTYIVEGSNNGTTWVDVNTGASLMLAAHGGTFSWVSINVTTVTTTQYRYWRLSFRDSGGGLTENPGGF